jgi:hypothetical protein
MREVDSSDDEVDFKPLASAFATELGYTALVSGRDVHICHPTVARYMAG